MYDALLRDYRGGGRNREKAREEKVGEGQEDGGEWGGRENEKEK